MRVLSTLCVRLILMVACLQVLGTIRSVSTQSITSVAKCDDSKCERPNGRCTHDMCVCFGSYYGRKCDKEDESCGDCEEGMSCKVNGRCEACAPACHHGTCVTTERGPRCLCQTGWEGDACRAPERTTTTTGAPTTTRTAVPTTTRTAVPTTTRMPTTTTTANDAGCDETTCRSSHGNCVQGMCVCIGPHYGRQCRPQNRTCVTCQTGEACLVNGECGACQPACDQGSCMTTQNGPRCICDAGWRGAACHRYQRPGRTTTTTAVSTITTTSIPSRTTTVVDARCDESTCRHPHGDCIQGMCVCIGPHFGSRCIKQVRMCITCDTGEACLVNGECGACDPACTNGVCRTTENGPRCICDGGWSGDTCNVEIETNSVAKLLPAYFTVYVGFVGTLSTLSLIG